MNNIEKNVIVIIPRYKENLENLESISLAQGKKILHNYDICYISPEKMRSYYQKIGEKAEFFSDRNFDSVKAYSLLLLSPQFYQRFIEYDYMLIYQLDAFVFYDKLSSFCNMEYDYIGAPLPYWVGWPYSVNRVGNGGLSLRKVKACYKAVKEYMPYVASKEPFLMSKLLTGEYGEDCFFIYCGWSKDIDFKTAPTKVAIKFSLQSDFNHVFDSLSERTLPFGCHAWNKLNAINVWKSYIETRGYILPSYLCKENDNSRNSLMRLKTVQTYGIVFHLINEMIRLDDKKARERVLQVVPKYTRVVIWGNGGVGRKAIKLMLYLNIEILFIVDKKAYPNQIEDGIDVISPCYEKIKKSDSLIVIASMNYGDEIANNLSEMGLVMNKDYIFFWDIAKKMALEIAAVMYKGRMYNCLYKKIMD